MIRILSKDVASKIAAGEVVDRPLSVVKELVENAIDAGANAVVVEIKNGGKAYIRVTDNGCGIPSEEVLLAFQRHATSKIVSDRDLLEIRTLGFRGEALASISAVSRTEVVTKTDNEKTGSRVCIEGSEVVLHTPVGAPLGTTIIVSDLFYNTPARFKFMKSDAAESTIIIDFISKIALAYANIKIRLISNGNVLFSTQGKGDVKNSILTIYSKEVGENLLPLAETQGDLSISGFISVPSFSKSNKRTQVYFVNGRVVVSKVMEKGVSDAYSDKLFEGRYPLCFLFLQSAPEKVDVNIHPNKREVRFDDEAAVSAFITAAVRKALQVKESIPEVKQENLFIFPEKEKIVEKTLCQEEPRNEFLRPLQEQVNIKNILSTIREEEKQSEEQASDFFLKEEETPYAPQPFDMSAIVPIDSIFATYIVAVDEDSFYLIDQHAAHERIFFEKLMEQYQSYEKIQQPILVPFVIHVSYAVKNDAFDWLDALCKAGFHVEEFGPKAFLVKAVPVFMTLSEATDFIEYFLDNINEYTDLTDPVMVNKIMANSCRSAIKAGDLLAKEEIRELLSALAKCKNPYSCPHGRPTFIRMTKASIEKMFKRV